MILTLLTGKERKPRPCVYELARDGQLCKCGAPPVAKISKGGLCLEHTEFVLMTADCECRDQEERFLLKKEFLERCRKAK